MLKTMLEQQHKLKPDVKNQKLLHAGKILKDEQVISEIIAPKFGDALTEFTFHLMITSQEA